METISAFIDGGGSVLVAASSDIGKSGFEVLLLLPFAPGSLESFVPMEAVTLALMGRPGPGSQCRGCWAVWKDWKPWLSFSIVLTCWFFLPER